MTFSPDGDRLASTSLDKTVRLWDPNTKASCGILEGHSAGVWAVASLPDGDRLVSVYWDKIVRLWDIRTYYNVQELYTRNLIHDGPILQTAFGMLELKHLGDSQSQQLPSASLLLHVRGGRMFGREDNIVRLPFEYQATCWAIKNNVLALAHASSRVTFIEFDPDHMPPGKTTGSASMLIGIESWMAHGSVPVIHLQDFATDAKVACM